MKICVAQTRPATGDIAANIANHKKLIDVALSHGAGLVVFPELSLTGYEPELAGELATHPDDHRLDIFQDICDAEKIIIGVGMPTKSETLPRISTIFFQAGKARQTHAKKYLHSDEEPFFCSGDSPPHIRAGKNNIALAICYELSVPQHAEHAAKNGADISVASAAKDARGTESACNRLAEIARQYSMIVLLANCIGPSGGYQCAGGSAIWSEEGALLKRLGDSEAGVLTIDSETRVTSAEAI